MKTDSASMLSGESGLRSTRKARGMGLRQAAGLAEIDPAHLSKVERGEKGLSLPALRRLAVVLEMGELVSQLDQVLEASA
ncbi:helix-turn-helix domain-containing protein [Nonomuraea sp. NPDC002799]